MGIFQKAKDFITNCAGGLIGYLGIVGLRYPVRHYMFDVAEGLTRGSRLNAKEVAYLKENNFKLIVSLCAESNADEDDAALYGIKYIRLKIVDNRPPSMDQMVNLMRILKDPANRPAYIHCQAGKGRTGVAIACYRVAFEGWTPGLAVAEAKDFGMGMPSQEKFIYAFADALRNGRIKI